MYFIMVYIWVFFLIQGGIYMLSIMDTYSGGWSILFIAIFECISVGWVYGKDFFLKS